MGDTLNDLTGIRFGKWIVESRAENRGKAVMWNCVCDCGVRKVVHGTSLKGGVSTSCGCERKNGKPRTHGLTKHPLYRIWQRMKGCTTSKTHQDYKHYGARGIVVCEEWFSDFEKFHNWAIDNGWSKGLEIDRIDVNGNYEPGNCRFTNRSGQMSNTRRTHFLTFDGKTQSVADWARELGIKPNVLYSRINKYGWSIEKALTTEVVHANRNS